MTVPPLPGRSRYNILGVNPTWVYHRGTIDGNPPERAGQTPAEVDPDIVIGGRAEFTSLTHGGLFTLLGNYGKPLLVEEADIASTFDIVRPDSATPGTPLVVDTGLDPATALPLTLPAGHYLKASGGGSAGFKVRILDGAEKVF